MKGNAVVDLLTVTLIRDVGELKAGDVLTVDPQHGPIIGRYVLDSQRVYRWDGVSRIKNFRGTVVAVEHELVADF